MSLNTITPPTTQSAPAQRTDAAQKLESARSRVRSVLRGIATTEGRFLDFDTAEDMSRTLSTVARDLEELSMTIAVMQRREAR